MNHTITSKETDWKNSSAFRDLLLIGLIAILAFILVEALELVETVDKIRREYEGWPITEIITLPLILSCAFGAYSLRRWKELRYEIIERKKVEENLRVAYKKLKKSNQEIKEMQIQLVQSEKLASIGQLAAGVAHEINNPLGFASCNFETLENYIGKIHNLLNMYDELIGKIEASEKVELLEKAEAIEETRNNTKVDFILENVQELFDDTKEGLERIGKIVENLRNFSRIDQQCNIDKYNLNDGIQTALVVAKNEIQHDVHIKTELSEVPRILCNPGKINQVFLNIIVNAAQAIEAQERKDKGTITIKTYQKDDRVVCEISDNGCGIPPEKLSKIFDPFFTTKPVGEGTGLGLSVSYDIIAIKHKGKLLVDSTVGEGTKFTIELPISNNELTSICEIEENGTV
jgi:signal transduction histidine kinase